MQLIDTLSVFSIYNVIQVLSGYGYFTGNISLMASTDTNSMTAFLGVKH